MTAAQKEVNLAIRASDNTGGSFAGLGNGSSGNLLMKENWYFDDRRWKVPAPLVAGISPLMESQVLDLKDSFGRQDQIALALAVSLRQAGQKGSAQF